MTRLNRPNRALLAGMALSLVIHAGTLLIFGRAPLGALLAAAAAAEAAASKAEAAKALEPPTPEDDPLRLGIAESDAVTVNWIGFEKPTEHRAPQSTSDQPALAITPGASETPAPTPADAPPEPSPQVAEQPQVEATPEPSVPQAKPSPSQAQLDELLNDLAPALQQLLDAAQSAMAAAPRPPPPPSTEPGAGDPGEASDRDSDPTALAGTFDVVPGHPAAHKGLEIKTVRPRWLTLTKMTSTPDNPTVIIKFRRNGTVYEADFEAGKSTGFKSVDGPLLDAIYAWRASGKALERLPANDPDATLEVHIRVIMH